MTAVGGNLEQRIYIEFCVQIGNSASGKAAILIVAYGEYAREQHRRLSVSGSPRLLTVNTDYCSLQLSALGNCMEK